MWKVNTHRLFAICASLILGILHVSCATRGDISPDENRVAILVGSESTLQPGVEVSAIMRDGTRTVVGVSDGTGQVVLDLGLLRSNGAVCLLFAMEGFFTGAIWLDGYKFGSPEYIELAKFTVM